MTIMFPDVFPDWFQRLNSHLLSYYILAIIPGSHSSRKGLP